jgi:hypothetical protein
MLVAHPWNANPLPPPRYRLIVVHRRNPDNELVAVSVSREALLRLEAELAGLDYDFVRCERLN